MKNKNLIGVAAMILMFMTTSCDTKREDVRDSFAQQSQCRLQEETLYLNPDGTVTDSIVQLMGLTGIRIPKSHPEKSWPRGRMHLKSRALSEVVPAIQGKLDPSINWLGDPKKERWEKDPKKLLLSKAQAKAIIEIAENDLKLKQEALPVKTKDIKGVLFLGAALQRVRTRLAFLNDLYQTNKLSPTLPVYLLTGERNLDEKIGETQHSLTNSANGILPFRKDWVPTKAIIQDEGEMVKLVFAQSRHKSLSESNLYYVYSPKGDKRRATTESTVVQWLKDFSPEGGDYIAISNQPYNFYQEAVIRRVLLKEGRPDICVEVVGPAMDTIKADEDLLHRATNLLNTISRILYELLDTRKDLPGR